MAGKDAIRKLYKELDTLRLRIIENHLRVGKVSRKLSLFMSSCLKMEGYLGASSFLKFWNQDVKEESS